ncbi:hypothetical protein HBN76_04550 [Pseudomonas sp. WS 5013]|uniref:hypothetical protein n=1 Tax=Pseudomonas sp. WS 5013 TaxID=2717475 RepID=UPI001473395E|nr:hypothetical protein [Pseudomonas sp. WS 5013]NMY40568.1 hypothetical protein [Pseudomonas sp. WS 5013]
MWPQIVWLVACLIISIALQPKPKSPKPTAFEDIDFPLCDEGEDKTAVFGQVWQKGWMVLTVGNYRTKKIKSEGGKK